jgi:hypothetical protein
MSEQKKAQEIVNKMQYQRITLTFEQAKQSALILIDEILFQIGSFLSYGREKQIEYWQNVKREIEKL